MSAAPGILSSREFLGGAPGTTRPCPSLYRINMRVIGLLFCALAAIQPVRGQMPGLSSPSPPAAKNSVDPDPLGRDTPYGCVFGFLKAAEREEYGLAAEYLDMKPSPQALDRARQLRAILNANS